MSETFRQAVHLLIGLPGAAVILSLDDRGALVFVIVALVALFLLCDAFTRGYDVPVLSGVMDAAERRGKVPLKGGIAYAIGALFCLVVFGREYTAVGLVTPGVLDSVAAIAGLRFGRYILRRRSRWRAPSPGRSWPWLWRASRASSRPTPARRQRGHPGCCLPGSRSYGSCRDGILVGGG